MLAVQAGSDAELERRGTLVSAASSSDGTLRSAERSANADGNHTGIFRRVFFFFFLSFPFFGSGPFWLSARFLSKVVQKKRENREEDGKQQQENKKIKKKWARSLCPLDVKDQRKYFKILFTTTRSETSPDEKKSPLVSLGSQ